MGRLGSAYGLKGWMKVQSFASRPEDLFDYSPWYIRRRGEEWREVRVEEHAEHGSGFIAKLCGCSSPEEAKALTGKDSLVVVDTSRPEQTQVPELLTAGARVVVIDHHRRAASYIQNPALSFHDPYASSASELTAELVQTILDAGDLAKEEAEVLLSGIVLDTKSFTMRTGSRTFEIAAYLRKNGADITQVSKFFQNDLEDTVAKFRIIQDAQRYREAIAIAVTDRRVGRPIAARAADELLNIAGIEASFVLFPEEGQTCLSARSSAALNVQVISEMLGGGGNASTAGAQFPGQTTDQVLPKLREAIDKYLDEDET